MGNAGYGNHTEAYGEPDRPDAKAGGTAEKPRDPAQKPQPVAGAKDDQMAPAGPHADPSLTNEDATPGAGTLTPPGDHDDVDSTSS
jgi:hypothetical protein